VNGSLGRQYFHRGPFPAIRGFDGTLDFLVPTEGMPEPHLGFAGARPYPCRDAAFQLIVEIPS